MNKKLTLEKMGKPVLLVNEERYCELIAILSNEKTWEISSKLWNNEKHLKMIEKKDEIIKNLKQRYIDEVYIMKIDTSKNQKLKSDEERARLWRDEENRRSKAKEEQFDDCLLRATEAIDDGNKKGVKKQIRELILFFEIQQEDYRPVKTQEMRSRDVSLFYVLLYCFGLLCIRKRGKRTDFYKKICEYAEAKGTYFFDLDKTKRTKKTLLGRKSHERWDEINQRKDAIFKNFDEEIKKYLDSKLAKFDYLKRKKESLELIKCETFPQKDKFGDDSLWGLIFLREEVLLRELLGDKSIFGTTILCSEVEWYKEVVRPYLIVTYLSYENFNWAQSYAAQKLKIETWQKMRDYYFKVITKDFDKELKKTMVSKISQS